MDTFNRSDTHCSTVKNDGRSAKRLVAPAAVLFAAILFAATLFTTGCKQNPPPSKPVSQLTPAEQSGRGVFDTHCAGCHYATSIQPLHGPGLQGLFKRPYLPSGAPANDDRVSATVIHGRNNMPPMGGQIDDQQMTDLLAYLHTL